MRYLSDKKKEKEKTTSAINLSSDTVNDKIDECVCKLLRINRTLQQQQQQKWEEKNK